MNVIKKIEQLVLERNYEEALKLCNEWDMDLAKVIKHMPDEGILDNEDENLCFRCEAELGTEPVFANKEIIYYICQTCDHIEQCEF